MLDEGVAANGPPRPVRPPTRGRAEHELAHVPYRDFCIHCGRASGRIGLHVCSISEQGAEEHACAVATYHFDYTYMTDIGRWLKTCGYEETRKVYNDISNVILVTLDCKSVCVYVIIGLTQGVRNGWPVQMMLEELEACGLNGEKITTRCGKEKAIVEVQAALWKRRSGITSPPIRRSETPREMARSKTLCREYRTSSGACWTSFKPSQA